MQGILRVALDRCAKEDGDIIERNGNRRDLVGPLSAR
jgi:hypothetical protein